MSKNILIRGLSEETINLLKAQSKEENQSLQKYLEYHLELLGISGSRVFQDTLIGTQHKMLQQILKELLFSVASNEKKRMDFLSNTLLEMNKNILDTQEKVNKICSILELIDDESIVEDF